MIGKPDDDKQYNPQNSVKKDSAKGYLAAIGYGALLTGFTVYLLLDTFVLSSAYQTNASQMNLELFEQAVVSESETAEENIRRSNGSGKNQRNSTENIPDRKSGANQSAVKDEAISDVEAADETLSRTDAADSTMSLTDDTSGTMSLTDDTSGTMSLTDSTAGMQSTAGGTVTTLSVTGGTDDMLSAADGTLSYEDENVSITVSEYVEQDTHIYVADVILTSAEYLKTAFADDIYGKNITDTTSAIASEHDAILAVNGDFYGTQESGYVIRNGIVYRDSSNGSEILCIYADGSMKVLDSEEYTAQELVDQGVWQAWSFGPGLIEQGKIAVSETDEVGKAKASNPRTAIGMIDENHYVFVVSDGRTDESEGLSLYELAAFLQKLGVTTAYNLDGGGSSTMVFQGELVNQPVSGRSNSERKVSDIVYIG